MRRIIFGSICLGLLGNVVAEQKTNLFAVGRGEIGSVTQTNGQSRSSRAVTWEEHKERVQYEKERLKRLRPLADERERLSYIRSRGASEESIFRLLENEAIKEGIYEKVENVDDWMLQYYGEMLGESSYDLRDEWDYDFSSPSNALRSYWHAYYKLDVAIILRHSDVSFIRYLETQKKRTLLGCPPKYGNDGMTKVTPLLSGKCVMDGKEYTLVLYRREFPKNPQKHTISIQWESFVFLNGRYYLSFAPAGSQFAKVYESMGTGYIYPAGIYETLSKKLEPTNVPKHFYIIKGN